MLAGSLALSACATTSTSTSPPQDAAPAAADATATPAPAGPEFRDLTPPEKKVITDAIVPTIRDAGSAKYRWAKFPTDVPPSGEVPYCGIVDAKSEHAAYSGRQAYIVDTKVVGGKVTSAVMGMIAGGKDIEIIRLRCNEHGLDPNKAK